MTRPHRIRPSPRCLASDRSGTSAVEFAILSPFFMLFVLGMLAYGILLGANHSVQQIAADAARVAIAGVDAAERRALVEGFVERNAGAYMFVDPDRVEVEASTSPSDAGQFVVSIRYDASQLPIWSLFADLPMPGKTIARTSTIRTGGL